MSTLVFKTENSEYSLEISTQGFRVTKIAEFTPNGNGISLGYTKFAWNIHLRIGDPFRMHGLTTTPVQDIQSFEQWVSSRLIKIK